VIIQYILVTKNEFEAFHMKKNELTYNQIALVPSGNVHSCVGIISDV